VYLRTERCSELTLLCQAVFFLLPRSQMSIVRQVLAPFWGVRNAFFAIFCMDYRKPCFFFPCTSSYLWEQEVISLSLLLFLLLLLLDIVSNPHLSIYRERERYTRIYKLSRHPSSTFFCFFLVCLLFYFSCVICFFFFTELLLRVVPTLLFWREVFLSSFSAELLVPAPRGACA
jgi:hypothetical protein